MGTNPETAMIWIVIGNVVSYGSSMSEYILGRKYFIKDRYLGKN